jgi:hypothetical protein
MKRWQLVSVAALLLVAAGFTTGSMRNVISASSQCALKSTASASRSQCATGEKATASATGGQCAAREKVTASAPRGQCTAGEKATVLAIKPDPAMSAMCERSCAARDYDPTSVVAQPGAHAGDLTRCPVSGVVFTVVKDNASVSYAGKDWLTCCGSCAKKLSATPERFLGGGWISGAKGAQAF